MASELQKVTEQSRELWQKLPPRRRAILIGAVAATVALGAFLTVRPAGEDYAVLSAGLQDDEAAHIVEFLKVQAIPYKIERGNAIEVPASRLHDARLGLALNDVALGGGAGFELFDKQTFGTTSFGEQVNYQRALQGELERTIRFLEPVQKARVHITRPERSLFKDDEQPPTASVTVSLKPGRRLSQAQIRGIVHTVAASVDGLQAERVTLIDDSGAVLSAGGDDSGAEGQQELERTLARRVGMMVERVVGPGHAEVAVTAEIDLARTERTEELWDKDKIALRSESKSQENNSTPSAAVGGVAGAAGNLPGSPAPAPAAPGAAATSNKQSDTRNYEVDRIVNHIIGPKARVKKIHVAVLVDYAAKAGGKPGERVTRTPDELKRIEELAREAAGIDAERGDHLQVVSAPFMGDGTADEAKAAVAGPLSKPLLWAAIAAPAVLVVLGLALALRRRRRQQQQGDESIPLLPATVGELERNLPAGSAHAQLVAPSARERAAALAQKDAARAAQLIAGWLVEPPAMESKSP